MRKYWLILLMSISFTGLAYAVGLDSNTKLMLHMDGVDGAVATTDVSDAPHAITFGGTAQLDTAQYKWATQYGASSLLLDGDSDYLTAADSTDWDICATADENWTIDFWISLTTHAGAYDGFVSQVTDGNNGWWIAHAHGSGISFDVWSGGGSAIATGSGGEITDSNWHHIALCRVGSKYAIYKDGVQVNYTDDASTFSSTGLLQIGAWDNGEASYRGFVNGYIDELRVQKSNYFNASPNVGLTNTIGVPGRAYERYADNVSNFGAEF